MKSMQPFSSLYPEGNSRGKRSEYRKKLPSSDPESSHRLSHFSARAIKTGFDLSRMYGNSKFVLIGEEKNPSTADLAESYINRRVAQLRTLEDVDFNPQFFKFHNRNGTQQQLDAIADLQASGKVGQVGIPVFEFHVTRVSELVDRWGIQAEIVEIELAQERYLQYLANR